MAGGAKPSVTPEPVNPGGSRGAGEVDLGEETNIIYPDNVTNPELIAQQLAKGTGKLAKVNKEKKQIKLGTPAEIAALKETK